MDKKTGIIIGVGTGVTAIVAGGAYFSPYLTLNSMKTATTNRDVVALANEIDFPSLRKSVKEGVRAKLAQEVAKQGNNIASSMGGDMLTKVVDPAVDKLVTPEGLSQLMQDKIPGAKIDIADLEKNMADSQVEMGYESIDRFVVHISDKVDRSKQVKLILQRDGFSWKLAGVNIPNS